MPLIVTVGVGFLGLLGVAASASLLGSLVLITGIAPPSDQASVPSLPQPLVQETRSFAWDGVIVQTACVPTGLGDCAGVQNGFSKDHFATGLGDARSLRATLAWKAPATGLSTLVLFASAKTTKDCGPSCTGERYRLLERAAGTSPLTLELPSIDLAPGEELAFIVRPADPPTGSVHYEAWTDQPFNLAALATLG